MRLDKYIALQGYTRKEAHVFLHAGRVKVDDAVITDAGHAVHEQAAHVQLDGKSLLYCASLYLMLNKPAGVLTAASDARHATVMDLLPSYAKAQGCMPVGRLDIDTEGLLLCMTDGQLAHRLLSPKMHIDKLYEVIVDTPLHREDVDAFAAGIQLSDFMALPAKLTLLGPYHAHVTLREGKFHQVKRMFAQRGKQVTFLKRLSFGGIWLDEALAIGQWRLLTPEELDVLYTAAGLTRGKLTVNGGHDA